MRLFHKAGDYAAFEQVLAEGLERYAVDLLTYCIMPNHWHLVVRPSTGRSLGHWMGRVRRTAGRLKLDFTLRGPGRPRKSSDKQ